ncbi:hypothetical protein ACT7DL_15445 [Bacillus paranthracis]
MDHLILNYKPILDSYCFVKEESEEIVFFNRDTYITLNGDSVEDILDLIPLLSGELSTEQLAKKLELPIEYLCEIIKVLDENNIIKNYDMLEKYKFMDKDLQRYEKFISNLTGSVSSAFGDIEVTHTKKIVLMGNRELQENLKKAFWYQIFIFRNESNSKCKSNNSSRLFLKMRTYLVKQMNYLNLMESHF